MSGHYDVAVLGAGPAGASAAIAAAAQGLRVVLLDENKAAGGQVYRAPLTGLTITKTDTDTRIGDGLRDRLASSAVESRFERQVWLAEAGFKLNMLSPDGPETINADALIVATGALERHVPCPGWTLPGVIGLAAATVLLKSHKILPGRNVVVAGAGPLLFLVAAKILKGGGNVAALIDASDRGSWIRHLPAMLSQPHLFARGAAWLGKLRARGAPILRAHAVRAFSGHESVTGAVVGPLDSNWLPVPGHEKHIACDAVCYGFGLKPAIEAALSLGAQENFDPAYGGWHILARDDRTTNVPRLYVCGDGAGVFGAAAAVLQGEMAGLAVARDLGRMTHGEFETRNMALRRACKRAERFGGAMTALATPRTGVAQFATSETIVCRCENLTRQSLDQAIAAGATTINALKSATRCGMGACGGKVCEDAAAGLIAAATGRSRAEIGHATARPPLRPVPLETIAGNFDYDSLPFPEPAPL